MGSDARDRRREFWIVQEDWQHEEAPLTIEAKTQLRIKKNVFESKLLTSHLKALNISTSEQHVFSRVIILLVIWTIWQWWINKIWLKWKENVFLGKA